MKNAVKLCVICLIFVSVTRAEFFFPASKCPNAGTCYKAQIWDHVPSDQVALTLTQKDYCHTCGSNEYSSGKVECIYNGANSGANWPYPDYYFQCYTCPSGQVANSGRTGCIWDVSRCPAGTFSVTTTVNGGSRATGETWVYNPGTCYSCRKGYYTSTVGTVGSCTPCPIGTYAPSAGSTSCMSCSRATTEGAYTC